MPDAYDIQQALLEHVWRAFRSTGEWPFAQKVEVELGDVLDPKGGIEAVCREIGSRYIICETPELAGSRIKLRIDGVAKCKKGAADVEVFLALLRYASDHYRTNTGAAISLEQFVADTAVDEAAATRAFKYSEIDGGRFWGGRTGTTSLTPDRFSRRLRNVRTLEDLREQLKIEADAMSVPGVPSTRGILPFELDADQLEAGAATPQIFLSHSGRDAALAEFLEKTIRSQLPGAKVFRTSRPDQLPSGESWFRSIEDNLKSSSAYLVLITSNSETRPWILFETGAAWYSEKTLVPALVGISKESIAEPLRLLQLLDLEVEEEAEVAFQRLEIPPPDLRTFVNAVQMLGSALKSSPRAKPEWGEFAFSGNRYVWSGPVHQLTIAPNTPCPDGLIGALGQAGLIVTQGYIDDPDGAEAARGFYPLFYVDKWDGRHWLVTEQRQALYVKPTLPPRNT